MQGCERLSGIRCRTAWSSLQGLPKGQSPLPSRKRLWLSCTSTRCWHGGWENVQRGVDFLAIEGVFLQLFGRLGSFLGLPRGMGHVGADLFQLLLLLQMKLVISWKAWYKMACWWGMFWYEGGVC
jgi:hypothetical protein